MPGYNRATPAVDSSYGATVTMGEIHALTHAGDVYIASEVVTITSGTPTRYILIDCTNHSAHIVTDFSSSGDSEIEIYAECPDVTGGTAITSYNKNRYSSKTANVALTHTPTVTDIGTNNVIATLIPGGGKKGPGGTAGDFDEFIFKSGSQYCIKITNTTSPGVDIRFNTIITWYEIP